ncbi:MAG: hypothetical protein EXS36_06225 [Pedosphaera sp.]|nr:hypothetical protein [Pedosphaera sp.]
MRIEDPPSTRVSQLSLRGSRRRTAGWLLALAVLVSVFFAEHVFFGRSLLPLDVLNEFLLPRNSRESVDVQTHYPIDEVTQLAPNAMLWRDSVMNGRLPLWNPFILGGQPHFANSIWGILTPFKLPLLLFGIERGYTLGLVFQFWLAGALMFAFLREIGRTRSAAFLGGATWCLCSNFVMFHWLFLNVFLWMPLVLLCWERGVGSPEFTSATGELRKPGPRPRWFLACAAVLSLAFLGGSIQFAAVAGLWWTLYALAGRPPEGRNGARLRLGWMAAVAFLAALLAAVQLIPLLEFLPRETQRLQYLDPGSFGWKNSLFGPLAMVATFIFPGLAGSPQSFDVLKVFRASQIDFNGYLGATGWMLAFVGAFHWRNPRRRLFFVLATVAVVLVFFTPLQRFLYHRFLLLAVFAGAALAAAGLDILRGCPAEDRRRISQLFRLGGIVAVALAAFLIAGSIYVKSRRAQLTIPLTQRIESAAGDNAFRDQPDWLRSRVPRFLDHYRLTNPVFLFPIFSLLSAAAAAHAWRRGRLADSGFQSILVALCVIELSTSLRDRVPRIDTAQHPFYPVPAVYVPILQDPDVFRVHRWMPDNSLLLRDNIPWAYGLSTVTGYDSLAPNGLRNLPLGETNGFNHVLDLINVKYVLTSATHPLPEPRFTRLIADSTVQVWHNRDWLPRIQVVTNGIFLPASVDLMTQFASLEFDPRRDVYLDTVPTPIVDLKSQTAPPTVSSRVIRQSPGQITADIASPVPGFAVFAETYYPGWTATLDGRALPILRANGVMQAVAIPAGRHQLEFRFTPKSFRFGAGLSAITLLFIGWLARKLPAT